jgi:hypothetical protein
MIPVKGHSNLYRDEISGAIINCDSKSYNQYMIASNNRKVQQHEIEQIKKDIDEIKSLIKEFINESRRN